MSLRDYARKRRFSDTPEPADDAVVRSGKVGRAKRPIFVVQLHNARARHYDFRLEVDGALRSWAVPKGPSLRAGEKRLAVEVEDHPLSYAGFEGEIPQGNYGAGHVLVFDRGVWSTDGDPQESIAAGKLDFNLAGGKLRGGWKLVRTRLQGGRGGGRPQWLLIKRDDAYARDADANDLVEVEPGAESSEQIGRRGISGNSKPDATKPAKVATERTAIAKITRKAIPRKAVSSKTKANGTIDWHAAALALHGARDRALPAGFKPQLATLREAPRRGEDWLHEVKWDGYRLLADLDLGAVRLRSRNGLDWTQDFPEIAAALEALPVSSARFDGELVALDSEGRSDFAALQRTIEGSAKSPLRYLMFDLPALEGVDLTQVALVERKQLLESLLARGKNSALAFSVHVVGHGREVFAASAKRGLEGIISKRVDAHYVDRRSPEWIKLKNAQSDEFLIVGYTAPRGSRSGFGSLLMATIRHGALHYVGRVGTGYDEATLRTLAQRLHALRRDTRTVELPPHVPFAARDVTWVEPQRVAEVAFRGWGKEGLLRQASFMRLRDDKTAEDLGMVTNGSEKKRTVKSRTTARKALPGKDVAQHRDEDRGTGETGITNPQRIVYPRDKISKGEVADYYRAIAPWILPELANRPLSLVRCPDGLKGQCFFQKHHAATLGKHVHAIELSEKDGDREPCVYIKDADGLLELVQMNTLEFHPWGARVDRPELADRLVFDLDPGEGVEWKAVVAAGRDVRARLLETGLQSWVRLSGGKGLHVVVPIKRGPAWPRVKAFCEAFADALAAHAPLTYLATASKAQRKGRIFIDWLRNTRGATSVTGWSLRARDGAPVAVPLAWTELGRVSGSAAYDIRTAQKRATSLKADPWADLAQCSQSLPAFSADPR